jgi:methylenetetrahydrofolate dehydrogenase (NADP+)/methenyltetrahydrofolate cyclohydrolase
MEGPKILYAKPLVELLKQEIRERAAAFEVRAGRKANLWVVRVGEDPASVIYTERKAATAQALGLTSQVLALPAGTSALQVAARIQSLNADPSVDGILLQRPLPGSFAEHEVVEWILPDKDVDAFHPLLAGKLFLGLSGLQPCTPAGIIKLLEHYGVEIAGKTACVIGRSSIVGKPMAALLLQQNATVIQAHSGTPHLREMTLQADILVVAAGKPGLIGPEDVRAGAVVVDVGIHRTPEGRLRGDARFEELLSRVSAITPVPGGVGPITIHQLLLNTLQAAEVRQTRIDGASAS